MANDKPEILSSLPVHGTPTSDPTAHQLRVDGLVRESITLDSAGLASLPRAEVTDDFICREGWCVPGLHWEGVSLATVLDLAGADPEGAFVQVSSADFSTPLSRVRRGAGPSGDRPRGRSARARARWAGAPAGARGGLLHEREVGRPHRGAKRTGRGHRAGDRPRAAEVSCYCCR